MNQKLIEWSRKNYADLPWRKNRTLYKTLVSEIMLQQTTVSTVLKHFDRFLEKFPNLKVLANASEEEVMLAWQGLGYYRRARNLKAAAEEIQKKYKESFPLERSKLIEIKGIGEYTASALRSIGADQSDLSLDANLERVLARFYKISEPKGLKLQKKLRSMFEAGEICADMDDFGGRAYNEALMDLGRTICQARSASCEICPIRSGCLGKFQALAYPNVQSTKAKESFELHLLRVLVQKNDQILVYKKEKNQWLSDQYELPTFSMFSEDPRFDQYPAAEFENYDLLPWVQTGITKYKILNFGLILSASEFANSLSKNKDFVFKKPDSIHLSTASHKIVKILLG